MTYRIRNIIMRAHIFVIFVVDNGIAVASSIILVEDVDFGTHFSLKFKKN